MLSRNLLLTLTALIGAAVVDGMVGAGTGILGRAWIAWPIVGGLAALVIAALAAHIRAVPLDAPTEAEAYFAEVDGQTGVIAAALVVIGIAFLLGTCAPSNIAGGAVTAFTGWAGIVALLMGFLLAIAKSAIGGRKPTGPTRTVAEQLREH